MARTIQRARTTAAAVCTRPGSMPVTGERSWITAPARSAASARPAARRAGWTRAQCGEKRPPSAPGTAIRARMASASRSTLPVSPHARWVSIARRTRRSSSGVWAACSDPPLWKSHAMPSAATTRPTSSTVASIARCSAATASRPLRRAQRSRSPDTSPSTQPPLRPDAPNPAVSASSTTTSSSGAARRSSYAVHRPVKPAPTMQTSASRECARAARGDAGASWSRQKDSPMPSAATPSRA